MKIIILGSGTLVPLAEHGSPGFIVEAAGEKLLFDSGSGSLYRAARLGIEWEELGTVFYSHFHPDHSLDLVSLTFAANYAPGAGGHRLKVHGPPGLKQFFSALCVAWPAVKAKNYFLQLRELHHGEMITSSKGWEVEACEVDHGESGALAYRITEGSTSVVYSGDTQYCDSLVEISREADLLICECSAPVGEEVPGHLSPAGVARTVLRSGVRRVLITHVYPPSNPEELAGWIRENCPAEVQAARDLVAYEV